MHKLRVTVEVEVEVFDAAALEHGALAAVAAAEFGGGEAERSEERAHVLTGPAAAADWLINPFLLIDDLPGVEASESVQTVINLDGSGLPAADEPDFATLFTACNCGEESCTSCSGFQLTPRTAYVLWSVAELQSDGAFDDVEQHGDEPMEPTGDWSVFDEYPRITWRRNAVWRRQAARAFDDLVGDLVAGELPRPTCPGEEMALHTILNSIEGGVFDLLPQKKLSDLPAHPDDLDWDACREALFQDMDILDLFDPRWDGLEDPKMETNSLIGMGDYRAEAWFNTFLNMNPRDGRRPFRR